VAGGEVVRLTATSFEDIAAHQPLRWQPAIPSERCNSAAFEHQWRRLQYLFSIPDPQTFPRLLNVFAEAELDALVRYVDHAKDLAESTLLNGSFGMTVNIPDMDSEPIVETNFPARDVAVGFSALFRQFHSHDEAASFGRVKGLLVRTNRDLGGDYTQLRDRHLQAWARAQGQLRAYDLLTLCAARVTGREPGDEEQSPQSPEQLISIFNYGDDLHWGDRRQEAAAWKKDAFIGSHQRMRFFTTVASLAHLYIGFREIVARCIRTE
jgi:hypothetical protein